MSDISYTAQPEDIVEWESRCAACRHFIRDEVIANAVDSDSLHARMEPPYAFCEEGILDKIVLTLFEQRTHPCHSYNHHEIKMVTGSFPSCERFSEKKAGIILTKDV